MVSICLTTSSPVGWRAFCVCKVSKAEAWAHLAVCGDELFVRDLESVTAYRWRTPPR